MHEHPATLSPAQQRLRDMWEEHMKHEFATKSVEDTMATMVEPAHVNHVPTMTGGTGMPAIARFYERHFIPRMPPDTATTPVSRTIGDDRIVDELLFSFTHTVEMDWMLPGVKPTGRRVEVPLVAIIGFKDGKVQTEHIYWDQASVLVQIGLLDASSLPVAGVEATRKVQDASQPSNTLIERARSPRGAVDGLGAHANPLDILLRHDAWATREVLRACGGLTDEQWHRRFEIGPGSLHDTLTHVVGAMLRWADRIDGPPTPLRPSIEGDSRRTPAELLAILEPAASGLAASADRARARGLGTEFEVPLAGRAHRFTLGAALVHVTTHGMHHRAQCLNMLRHLGVPGVSDRLPEIDPLDWYALRQSRTPRP